MGHRLPALCPANDQRAGNESCRSGGRSFWLPVVSSWQQADRKIKLLDKVGKGKLEPKNSPKAGYVYILVNPAFPRYVKIGKTTKDPEVRAKELSSGTGIPAPYGVAWDALVSNCDEVERLIHQRLAYARARNDREFFAIPLRKAVSLLTEIVAPFEYQEELPRQTIISEASGEPSVVHTPRPFSRQAVEGPSRTIRSAPMREELIEIAPDSTSTRSEEPHDSGTEKTIARISYEVLADDPYKFSEREFYHEVHVVRRERSDLKIENYNIKRSPLVKKYGWGIHRNSDGKLALVACESRRYQELLADPLVKKTKAYRSQSPARMKE